VKTRLLVGLGACVVVGAAVAAYYRTTHAATGPTLTTVAITRGDVVETVEATGTLQALTTVQVGTQVSGTIKALHADFNARVRRGQIVAELDPSLFQTQVEQARASVLRLEAELGRALVQREDAQSQLKRAQQLSARQLIAAMDLDAAHIAARQADAAVRAADAQLVQARASLNQTEVNLGHTVIRAPIDGIVISRNVDVGQTVAASMQAPTLFVIARDLAAMQVNASVAEPDIGRIAPGQRVLFHVDAYPDDVFTGTVSQVRLEPTVQQNVVSYITTIAVANPEHKLKPGMTATVSIEVARATGVWRVLVAALRVRPTREVFESLEQTPPAERPRHAREIWVLANGRLEAVAVRVGTSDGTVTEVSSDVLGDGVQVLTSIGPSVTTSGDSSPLLPFLRRPSRGARR
jgi:HlyD family secretion protein